MADYRLFRKRNSSLSPVEFKKMYISLRLQHKSFRKGETKRIMKMII